MKNNRRYKRFTVDVMNIKGKITVSNIVDVVDINTEEVDLKTDLRLNINGVYVLSISNDTKTLKLAGTVESSSISEPIEGPDGDIIPMYSAIIKLEPISNEALSDLNFFIEEHNREQEERVKDVGLHIEMRDKTQVLLSEGYKVKKISLNGMLIASGHNFQVDSGFPMELSLPGNPPFEFMGRIASCTAADENDLLPYNIGIAFLEMPDNGRQILRKFIKKLDEDDEEETDIWFRRKYLH